MLIRLLVYSQVFKEFSFIDITFTVCLRGRKRKGEKKVLVVWSFWRGEKGRKGLQERKFWRETNGKFIC